MNGYAEVNRVTFRFMLCKYLAWTSATEDWSGRAVEIRDKVEHVGQGYPFVDKQCGTDASSLVCWGFLSRTLPDPVDGD
jgi:hypothetical protein